VKEKTKFKRKILVNSRYQLSEVWVSVLTNLTVALLMAAFLSWFYLLVWNGRIAYNHNNVMPAFILCLGLIVSFVAIFLGLLRTRSIAGMIKKIDAVLTEASRGEYSKKTLVFRKGDYFSTIATPLNTCLEQLENNDTVLRTVTSALGELVKSMDSDFISDDELVRSLKTIMGMLEKRNIS